MGKLLLVFGAHPARGRGSRCAPSPAPGRSAHRHNPRRHSADMQFVRRFQAQHGHLRQPASRPRLLHGVLVGDGRPRQRHPRRPPLRRAERKSSTSTSATSSGRWRTSTRPSSTAAKSIPSRSYKTLKAVDFDGFMITDHVPHVSSMTRLGGTGDAPIAWALCRPSSKWSTSSARNLSPR